MVNLSPLERAIFTVLLGASIYGFCRRFAPIVRKIRASKKERRASLAPWGGRLSNFAWEVLLQGKVIRDRPLPGLAHACVFWGFCAFALITINHVAQAFHLRIFARDSLFGRFYFGLVGIFAIAVAVSIAALAVRRFIVRPRWLGELSPESGVIALLIFALMVTYLATFVLAEQSAAGKLNWWAHSLALLVFLPLIPRTKHLHLVLSPAAILLRREGFSNIPPLTGEEDFGLEKGSDITQLASLQAYSCVECGRCTEHCPAYNTGKVLNPKEVILGLRRYLDQNGPAGTEPIVPAYVLEEAIFQCTTCGACENQCPVGIQHLPIIVGLRRGVVNTGKWQDEHGTRMFLALERNGNALGFAAAERQRFIEKHQLPLYDETRQYCLWLGCMGAYDPQGREIILALVQVLQHLGITFGVLSREKCTGDPARRLGNDYLFSQLAEANIEQLRQNNATRLISICPHCVRTISEDWREFGATFAIEHHSELLARFQSQLPALPNGREKIVFHDPCYLGRYRNIYDEPRSVIARSSQVIEPPRTRHKSRCCGAGGGMMFLGEEKGKRVNVDRAEELAATGATAIGAACPFCQNMFRDALGAVTPNPPRLLDIAQIVAASISARQLSKR